MSMKNSSNTIGNRTRDLPAGSAVHQPTASYCWTHCELLKLPLALPRTWRRAHTHARTHTLSLSLSRISFSNQSSGCPWSSLLVSCLPRYRLRNEIYYQAYRPPECDPVQCGRRMGSNLKVVTFSDPSTNAPLAPVSSTPV